jgi:hypothetical protein
VTTPVGTIQSALCYLDERDRKKLQDEIIRQVRRPKYLCKTCIRVARDKDLLCRPKKLPPR